MSSTSATLPAWQQKIRDNAASLFDPTLGTISMSYLEASKIARLRVQMLGENYSVQESVRAQLLSIHIACVDNIRTATGTCIDSIRGLKNTERNSDVWKAAIESARQTATRSIDNRLGNAADEAIGVIEGLPDGQQDGAAELFTYGMGIVALAAERASNELGHIGARYLMDFLKGIWFQLEYMETRVKAVCDVAIKDLKLISHDTMAPAAHWADNMEFIPMSMSNTEI